MFPSDAITEHRVLSGVVTESIFDGESTLLGFSIQQENQSSISYIQCDGDVISQNYARDLSFNLVHYECDGDLQLSKSGNDEASFVVTYIPRFDDAPTTTLQVYNPPVNASSTDSYFLYNSFSAGEIVISILLLLIIFLKMAQLLARGLSTIRTKKIYAQYGGGDVEIREDL